MRIEKFSSFICDDLRHLRIDPPSTCMPHTVRFEQAVYGSFPFWDKGYAVLAQSPGCRPEWLAGLRAAGQRDGEGAAGGGGEGGGPAVRRAAVGGGRAGGPVRLAAGGRAVDGRRGRRPGGRRPGTAG